MDQPVKTYSSGMYVRLAFAAAINVDPDILIVDEALAVGDIKFQRKCFAKIEQLKKEGKTILFVTHALDSVNLHCDTAVIIDKGQMLEQGEPKEITRIYQKMMLGEDVTKVPKKKNDQTHLEARKREKEELLRVRSVAEEKLKTQKPGRKVEIIDYGILDKKGNKVVQLETGERYIMFSRVLVYEPVNEMHLGYTIQTVKGLLLFAVNSYYQKIDIGPVNCGDIIEGLTEITMWLAQGDYFVSFRAGEWMNFLMSLLMCILSWQAI
jgi:ABC-type proline/glycine betaine transport system ATPase subunit